MKGFVKVLVIVGLVAALAATVSVIISKCKKKTTVIETEEEVLGDEVEIEEASEEAEVAQEEEKAE